MVAIQERSRGHYNQIAYFLLSFIIVDYGYLSDPGIITVIIISVCVSLHAYNFLRMGYKEIRGLFLITDVIFKCMEI